MIEVELPLPKITEKKKTKNLSLNIYRNAYYRNLNNAKREYGEICRYKLLPFRRKHFDKAKLTFVLYNKTKQRRDLSNFAIAVDKIFSDVLVDMNIINDDDCTVIQSVDYRFGGYGEDKVKIVVNEVV